MYIKQSECNFNKAHKLIIAKSPIFIIFNQVTMRFSSTQTYINVLVRYIFQKYIIYSLKTKSIKTDPLGSFAKLDLISRLKTVGNISYIEHYYLNNPVCMGKKLC